ncbi:MAG: hypothetical protein ACETWG_12110, partial [Candidatus Neomarinimicrobiota bacterium]
MMRKAIIVFSIVTLGVVVLLYAKHDTESRPGQTLYKAYKTTTGPAVRSMSNISNWAYWIYQDGMSAITPAGGSGGGYPKGTAYAIFMDGFMWGGYREDDLTGPRVGGQCYRIGTVQGWIETAGTATTNPVAADPNDPLVGIYRIRADWATLTPAQVRQDYALLNDMTIGDVTDDMAQEFIDDYQWNWENWPTDLGAPFYDLDGDGVYEPDDGETPGIANADQVIWFVVHDLDASRTTYMYGSQPLGLELQVTLWAYNQPAARLGQIVFKKFKFINKSGKEITDMYAGQWCDPDVGNYADDVVGCDTLLSLGYAYNYFATDDDYDDFGIAVPAIGYDFFQGPIVESPGDTAIVDLKPKPGYKNLPMTSFGWFAAGSDISDPIQGVYDGTLQWYNLLKGYTPTVKLDDPTCYYVGNDPSAGCTKYPLAGDPVAGTGDVDGKGMNIGASDRRMVVVSGPFAMAAGDTQEIVVAVVGGLGDDNLSSVADLKLTDAVAQQLYDDLFKTVPKAPAGPVVETVPFENTVVLNWGTSKNAIAATEDLIIAGYEFEGYNVYQLPNPGAGKDQAELIATFDLVNEVTTITGNRFLPEYGQVVEVPVQFGADKGLQRYITLDKNYINGDPLYNGTTYYYAVTAYNYNAAPELIEDKTLESALIALPVTIQPLKPGTVLDASYGNMLSIRHTGPSDGQVEVKVIDPNEVTGLTYQIVFEEDVDTSSATYGELLWSVIDSASGEVVVADVVQKTSLDPDDQPIFDGLQAKVSGPELGVKQVYETDASDVLLDPRVSILVPSLGTTGYIVSNRAGACNLPPGNRDWDRFGYWGMDDFEIDFGDSSITWDYSAEEVHFDSLTGDADYAPFAVYRHVFETGERQRLFAGFYDTDGDGTWNMPIEDGEYVWQCPLYHVPSYEPIYCWVGYDAGGNDISYDPANEALYIVDNSLATSANTTWGGGTGEYQYPVITAMLFAMYLDGATPPWGHKVWFVTNKANTENDIFAFTAPAAAVVSADSAKIEVEKINVFPNPYYAYNPQEANRFDRFVTFNHLPPASVSETTIRIFTLAGDQVRKFDKTDETQFLKW